VTHTQKQIIAGLAFGSFACMLLVLFSMIAVPVLVSAGVASLGVFLGIFSGSLVAMSWATNEHRASRFLVTELA
jgi:hypothetical protein